MYFSFASGRLVNKTRLLRGKRVNFPSSVRGAHRYICFGWRLRPNCCTAAFINGDGHQPGPRICTHLIVYEGDSQAKMYIGNWSDYETMMIEKFGKDLTPHRVKYRTLKR